MARVSGLVDQRGLPQCGDVAFEDGVIRSDNGRFFGLPKRGFPTVIGRRSGMLINDRYGRRYLTLYPLYQTVTHDHDVNDSLARRSCAAEIGA